MTQSDQPPRGSEGLRIGIDPQAFEAFYREHIDAVTRFVARRVGDPFRAADLTADIFLAVIAAAGTYRPDRGPLVGWLYGVARNVIADDARRRGRELASVSRIQGHRLLDADSISRIEERLDAERECRRVYEALGLLPQEDQRLIELVAVDGMSIADAARELGVKPDTARVRLHRGRARILNHLATQPRQPVAIAQEMQP